MMVAPRGSTKLAISLRAPSFSAASRLKGSTPTLEALEKAAAAAKAEPMTLLIDKQGTLRNAESLARAIQTAVATQRDLHKLPTMDQTFEKKKWRDRMKLEREKLKGDSGIDMEVWKIVPPEGVTVDG